MRPSTCGHFATALLASTLLGCAEPTQLLVVVWTDMEVPAELEQIHVRVSPAGEDVSTYDNTLPLSAAAEATGAFREIASFGVGPIDQDAARRVRVRVAALAGGRALFETEARTGFAQRKSLRLDVYLARRCLAQAATCRPDQTCGLPGCVSPEVPVASLPPASAGPPDRPTDPRAWTAPRLLRPSSLATTTTASPTLVFVPAAGATDHLVVLDADGPPGAARTLTVPAGSDRVVSTPLSVGAHTWRVDTSNDGVVVASSATWLLFVPPVVASPAVDRAWGVTPDVNRDGLGDLVVASDRHVEVFVGRPGGPAAAPERVLHPLASSGTAVLDVAVADVDGDGFGDVAVLVGGAGSGSASEVVVYLGGPDVVAPARFVRTPIPSEPDGRAILRYGGDVDGDGAGELLVGSRGVTRDGHVYVVSRAHEGSGARVVDLTAPGDPSFGTAVAALGPLDDDGLDDFVVGTGAPIRLVPYLGGARPAPMGEGVLVFAGASLRSIVPAGDWTASGRPCVLGAYDVGPAATVEVWCTSASGLVNAGLPSWTGDPTDDFGSSIALAGDVDSDGRLDAAIGMPAAGGAYGGVTIERSTRGLHVVYPITPVVAGRFGMRVAGLGDFDGGGQDDVAVGAPGAAGTGRVYVMSGGPDVLMMDYERSPTDSTAVRFGHAIASR